ncbi:hypothetical protein J5N97_019387 [Dioscorea zingiberensis]|uniref:TF-B3 domain-containing protein n=1 Tax=Dioscorea zingiberensis TaxID=325984 RepID=A0A9D5CE12_9LILI|nr:hypothetical protein J5N97_019387 [Dioscorea zingiberensis]
MHITYLTSMNRRRKASQSPGRRPSPARTRNPVERRGNEKLYKFQNSKKPKNFFFDGSLLEMERKPHFFKVLLGDFSQRLKIPVEFMKNILNEASKRVTLQGPSGNSWHADFSKTSKDTFLCGGWADFAKDHALREFDFLVFRYDGDFHFTVMIFDRTACEREDLFTTIPNKRHNEGKDIPGRPVTSSTDVGSHLWTAIKKEFQEDNVSPLGPAVVQGNCSTHSETHKDAKIKPECDEPLIEMISLSSEANKKSCSCKRRHVTEDRRLQAQEAAYTFTSKFPFTVVCMRQSHVYTLKLPRAFSRNHLPRERTTMIIKDPNRKSWEVTYIAPQGDCDRLSGGWLAFYRANNLKNGDFCVFELVKPLEFNVHIFR